MHADGIGVAGTDLPDDLGHSPAIRRFIEVWRPTIDTGSGWPRGPDRRGAQNRSQLREHRLRMSSGDRAVPWKIDYGLSTGYERLRRLGRCRGKCTACHIGWRKGDRAAELLDPAHMAPFVANGIQAVEISGPETGVGAAIPHHVADYHEQRMS